MKYQGSAIFILGQVLEESGKLPFSLIARVEKGMQLVRSLILSTEKHPTVFLSGGDTAKRGITEARAMRNAINSPSSAEYVILEEKATNTVENAINMVRMCEKQRYEFVHLVTNEFHVPRAKCIFECVFERYEYDTTLVCHPATSGFVDGPYRHVSNRPTCVDQWHLCERLDWEQNALLTLNDYLARYSLGPVNDARIQQALNELRVMNVTQSMQDDKNEEENGSGG